MVCLALFKEKFNFFFTNLDEGKKNKHSPKFPNKCNCRYFWRVQHQIYSENLSSQHTRRSSFFGIHGTKEIQDISMIADVAWTLREEILCFFMPSVLEKGFKHAEKHGCRWKPLWCHCLEKQCSSIATSTLWQVFNKWIGKRWKSKGSH